MHRDALGPASELTGAWDVLKAAGCGLVPAVARVEPGTAARGEVVEVVLGHPRDAGTDDRRRLFLLHGSAVAHDDDPEGRCWRRCARARHRRPIAISLDHHAHVTTSCSTRSTP